MDIINRFYFWSLMMSSFPFIIQVSIVFIYSSLFLSIFFIIYLSFLRRAYRIKEILKKNTAPSVVKLFRKIIFEDYLTTSQEIIDEFEKTVSKTIKKKKETLDKTYKLDLAIETLIKIKQNSKVKQDRYSLILKSLEIENFIINKFSRSTPGVKKKAILQLSELGLSASDSKILSYTYSSNDEIQTEARLSYLNLSKNDPYRFFDEIKGEMSDWSQIKLMNLLIEQSNTVGLPNFGKWIGYSKNESLVIFLLKAAAYFNQTQAIDIIREKTLSENPKLRYEAYIALGKLKDYEIEDSLKKVYVNESDYCQEAILKAIGFLASSKSLHFLEKCFKDASNIEIKKIIALVVYDYGSEGKSLFKNMKYDLEKKIKSDQKKEEKNFEEESLDQLLLLFNHVESDLILYK